MRNNIVVISLGGSLVVPDEIDTAFLKNFKAIILRHLKRGKRFAIIVGGGKTAREYQQAAETVTKLAREDLDWIGIQATRINAHLLRAIFERVAHPKIIKNPRKKIADFKEKILVAGGWKPGFSTDYDAVLVAKQLGAKKLVNLSNIKYVYDRDPKKFKSAKPIKKMGWRDFRKLLPKTWKPGLNAPFDPVASREAERLDLEVAVMDGRNLKNFDRYLNNQSFTGSVIQ